jgi:hypothetical protein
LRFSLALLPTFMGQLSERLVSQHGVPSFLVSFGWQLELSSPIRATGQSRACPPFLLVLGWVSIGEPRAEPGSSGTSYLSGRPDVTRGRWSFAAGLRSDERPAKVHRERDVHA